MTGLGGSGHAEDNPCPFCSAPSIHREHFWLHLPPFLELVLPGEEERLARWSACSLDLDSLV